MSSETFFTWLWWLDGADLKWDEGLAALKKETERIREEDLGMSADEMDLEDVEVNDVYTYSQAVDAYKDLRVIIEGKSNLADYAHFKVAGIHFIVTGGTSWGDDPTESFSCLDIVNMDDINDVIGLCPDLPSVGLLDKITDLKAAQPMLLGMDEQLDEMIKRKAKDG